MVQVTVAGWPTPIAVDPGDTVLAAALAAGVPYPHGCQSGNCGACKSRVLAGEVDLGPVSEYALSDAERAAGLVLACRAVAWEDCTIAWLEGEDVEVHRSCRLTTRVVGHAAATRDITRLVLAVEAGGPFSFSAGQYAMVSIAGLPARAYSMANTPDQDRLEFHIRHLPGGVVSRYIAEQLAVGDTVMVEGPQGSAHLRRDHRGPVLAIAGGSGLAPIRSIVDTLLAADPARSVRLWHGVRSAADAYDQDWVARIGGRIISDRPVDQALDLGDAAGAKAYVAGPPPMVDAVTKRLVRGGVALGDIHADAFFTAADLPAGVAV
jgi:CDP-4-dehydro-6-deoxyglucose reductase/ferredoxin-NAD(P)+ reductase (naphthalene dioxygenase ferredoxin-specific)